MLIGSIGSAKSRGTTQSDLDFHKNEEESIQQVCPMSGTGESSLGHDAAAMRGTDQAEHHAEDAYRIGALRAQKSKEASQMVKHIEDENSISELLGKGSTAKRAQEDTFTDSVFGEARVKIAEDTEVFGFKDLGSGQRAKNSEEGTQFGKICTISGNDLRGKVMLPPQSGSI